MLGIVHRAAVKLDAIGGDTLAIGEGVETCMAAREFGFEPAWALGSVGAIPFFPVIPGVKQLVILGETGAAREPSRFAARVAQSRSARPGRDAERRRPLGRERCAGRGKVCLMSTFRAYYFQPDDGTADVPLSFSDIGAWAERKPPPREWAVPDRFPLRNVGLLSATRSSISMNSAVRRFYFGSLSSLVAACRRGRGPLCNAVEPEGPVLEVMPGRVGCVATIQPCLGATFRAGMTVTLVVAGAALRRTRLFTWRRVVAPGSLTAASGEEVVPASDNRALQNQMRFTPQGSRISFPA